MLHGALVSTISPSRQHFCPRRKYLTFGYAPQQPAMGPYTIAFTSVFTSILLSCRDMSHIIWRNFRKKRRLSWFDYAMGWGGRGKGKTGCTCIRCHFCYVILWWNAETALDLKSYNIDADLAEICAYLYLALLHSTWPCNWVAAQNVASPTCGGNRDSKSIRTRPTSRPGLYHTRSVSGDMSQSDHDKRVWFSSSPCRRRLLYCTWFCHFRRTVYPPAVDCTHNCNKWWTPCMSDRSDRPVHRSQCARNWHWLADTSSHRNNTFRWTCFAGEIESYTLIANTSSYALCRPDLVPRSASTAMTVEFCHVRNRNQSRNRHAHRQFSFELLDSRLCTPASAAHDNRHSWTRRRSLTGQSLIWCRDRVGTFCLPR